MPPLCYKSQLNLPSDRHSQEYRVQQEESSYLLEQLKQTMYMSEKLQQPIMKKSKLYGQSFSTENLYFPVEPNPPSPRAVSGSVSTITTSLIQPMSGATI